jgi:hypothetical protein
VLLKFTQVLNRVLGHHKYHRFDRFCPISGIAALAEMLHEDAQAPCRGRHERTNGRKGDRWDAATGPIGFHGGTRAKNSASHSSGQKY